MGIFSRAMKRFGNSVDLQSPPSWLVDAVGGRTVSGQGVNAENSRNVASAYRCGNIISDDVAKMPLKVFRRSGRNIEQVDPDARMKNLAYLLEVSPNRYQQSPFLFKKQVMQWLMYWGNAYIWAPPGFPKELFVLPANKIKPVFDDEFGLWYEYEMYDRGGKRTTVVYLPNIEVTHLLINPDQTGYVGRSVISYARESLGRQMGAYDTMGNFYAQGLNPSGIIWTAGELNKEAREKVRSSYSSVMSGSDNAYKLAVFDSKITRFEPVTMKPVDVQFLESIQATDVDIANFFGLPIYKLNMGKQSYQSNEQQNLDYLATTLDPYLVQWEQAARTKWFSEAEQAGTYVKFIRESMLRTDSKTRADYMRTKIESGQMTPNEARGLDDMSPYAGGDEYWMASNIARVSGGGGNG